MRSRISKSFWPEVVNWSAYILNRSLVIVVQDITPEKEWNRHELDVDHFRVLDALHMPVFLMKKEES